MSKEVEFMLSTDGDVMAVRSGSAAFIQDSRSWWETIWENRERFGGTAHSHPSGFVGPSAEDIGTYRGYEVALGSRLSFYVVTESAVTRVWTDGQKVGAEPIEDEPWWTGLLRSLSYTEKEEWNDD